MKEKYNIATIGTSSITESFIRSCKYVKNADLYCVYSRSENRAREFAEKNGAEKYYNDLNLMLSDNNIDIVYIASPNSLHYEQSKKCLEYGKNVLCEKPITVTPDEFCELRELAGKKGLIYLEAMKSMHSKGLPAIKSNINKLGIIRTAHLDFSQRSSRIDKYMSGQLPNIFNPEFRTGGLMDLGVYNVYVAVELFGKPDEIISSCDFLKSGADISGTVILKYKKFNSNSDLTVTITYSKAANGFIGSCILGDTGAILLDSVSKLSKVRLIDNDKNINVIYEENDEDKIMSEEIKDFIEYIDGQKPDYYEYCQETSETVSKILKKIRKECNFGF